MPFQICIFLKNTITIHPFQIMPLQLYRNLRYATTYPFDAFIKIFRPIYPFFFLFLFFLPSLSSLPTGDQCYSLWQLLHLQLTPSMVHWEVGAHGSPLFLSPATQTDGSAWRGQGRWFLSLPLLCFIYCSSSPLTLDRAKSATLPPSLTSYIFVSDLSTIGYASISNGCTSHGHVEGKGRDGWWRSGGGGGWPWWPG